MQKVVRDLIQAVGVGDALEIVSRWGGRTLRVPTKVARADPLALTIGYTAATKLVEALGGQELELPLERNALLHFRNQAIAAEAANGMSHETIAQRYGLTRRGVAKVLSAISNRPATALVPGVPTACG